MATIKAIFSLRIQSVMMLLLVALAGQMTFLARDVQAQTCTAQLSNLNVCGPFVVPGANGSPSADCCGALQSIPHDCLCNTLRIASRLPSACQLPPFSCAS